jgi:hypothetical protein
MYDSAYIRDQARIAAFSLFSRLCAPPSSSNPKIQTIVTELLSPGHGAQSGKEMFAGQLAAPELVSPEEGAVFDTYPRRVTLQWKPVAGAVGYIVEWDYYGGGVWASEGPRPSLAQFFVDRTSYTLGFVGAQPGRWRVWAVDAEDREGKRSAWRGFRFAK